MSKENLNQKDAVNKLKELAEKSKVCMFCTELDHQPISSRPMSLQEVSDDGSLWFISSAESNKNFDIKEDNKVQLYFVNNSDYEYLSIYGEAFVHRDKATIDDKWSSFANAWFDGKNDPNVTIIRVHPLEAYYWDTKAGKMVSFLSYAVAAVTGNKTDNSDGVEGKLSL